MNTRRRTPWTPLPGLQRGLTLIELMISITLGLVITLALIMLFLNISRASTDLVRSNLMIENGRTAMQILQQDVAHGGFWGAYVPDFDNLTLTSTPSDVPAEPPPDICLAYSSATWDTTYLRQLVGLPVQSFDAVPATCTSVISNLQPNTDIVVVRHAETCLAGVGNCPAEVASALYFEVPLCNSVGTPSTSFVMTTTTLPLTLTPTTPQWVTATLGSGQVMGVDCARPTAKKRKYIANLYYVRSYATTVGDGIPTLVRSRFDVAGTTLGWQPVEPLIEGIESLRVEWGVDSVSEAGSAVNYGAAVNWTSTARTATTNRGDGVPDGAYVRCTTAVPCTSAQLMNVVAARIDILARSTERAPGYTDTKTYSLGSTTAGPFNDGFKRHAFSTVVRLPNVAGRRDTP